MTPSPYGSGSDESDGVPMRIDVHDDIADISCQEWNQLLAACPQPTVFMRHEFLAALQRTGCASASTGWQTMCLTVRQGGELVAACALYLKAHSYGEFVFDWAWARAYEQAGLSYYPKLLCAAPFSPVPGSRLLARAPRWRAVLLQAMEQLASEHLWSSAHLLFIDDADLEAARTAGWLIRHGVQFHWQNREPAPYACWDDFLAHLQRDKRKKIKQERRRVQDAQVSFKVLRGAQIGARDWDFFYRCYAQTYAQHHAIPYLSRAFFSAMAQDLTEHWLLFVAEQHGQRIACSLLALDAERKTAYGRYWGAIVHVPCLHFEACYYQPLMWCIDQGWLRFEGGAQGEHKLARGLLPVMTASAHWLNDARFADAVAKFLEREGSGVGLYVNELEERAPFRRGLDINTA